MSQYKDISITEQFLDSNPNTIFVFDDNLERRGTEGSAVLRFHPQSYGFITKKFLDNYDNSFYRPNEYAEVFFEELKKLKNKISNQKDKIFYISKLGEGSSNKFRIWELVIQHNLELSLSEFENVIFCWK